MSTLEQVAVLKARKALKSAENKEKAAYAALDKAVSAHETATARTKEAREEVARCDAAAKPAADGAVSK